MCETVNREHAAVQAVSYQFTWWVSDHKNSFAPVVLQTHLHPSIWEKLKSFWQTENHSFACDFAYDANERSCGKKRMCWNQKRLSKSHLSDIFILKRKWMWISHYDVSNGILKILQTYVKMIKINRKETETEQYASWWSSVFCSW